MKKVTAFLLIVVFIGSVLFFFPNAILADTDRCFDENRKCRERVMRADVSWLKATLMLTTCDIAWGICIYSNSRRG